MAPRNTVGAICYLWSIACSGNNPCVGYQSLRGILTLTIDLVFRRSRGQTTLIAGVQLRGILTHAIDLVFRKSRGYVHYYFWSSPGRPVSK